MPIPDEFRNAVDNEGEGDPEVLVERGSQGSVRPTLVPNARRTSLLTADSVIGDPDCMLLAGRGQANDMGVAILPTSEGARFAVLDGDGEVFGDSLPFLPHAYHLGKRTNGAVLAGFGDQRLNSREFRDRETAEPVRIYMDGQVIYQSDKAWRFGVATDGSSFYVQEPLAGNTSRLVVHNLDELAELHFDLDGMYTPNNDYDSGFGVSYSSGYGEIAFGPVDRYGRGIHHFFSVREADRVREIRVVRNARDEVVGVNSEHVRIDGVEAAVFASSEVGYFAVPETRRGQYWRGKRPWMIERQRIDHESQNSSVEWSREVELENFSSTMVLSDDGAWLALRGWTLKVLDTATGDTVFEYPRVEGGRVCAAP